MCLCVTMPHVCVHGGQKGTLDSLGVTDSCEPFNLGAGDGTSVCCKNKCP